LAGNWFLTLLIENDGT